MTGVPDNESAAGRKALPGSGRVHTRSRNEGTARLHFGHAVMKFDPSRQRIGGGSFSLQEKEPQPALRERCCYGAYRIAPA